MSEIRERAKEWVRDCGEETADEVLGVGITICLLAELERVEKERDRLADDALTALSGVVCTPIEGFVKVPYELKTGIMDLRKLKEAAEQRIAELEAENERLKRSLVSLTPGGSEFADNPDACVAYLKDRLNYPRKIMSLQAEITRLNALLHKASQKSAEEFAEYVEEARMQAAKDCIDEMKGYPTTASVHVTSQDAKVARDTKQALIDAVKTRFGMEKYND